MGFHLTEALSTRNLLIFRRHSREVDIIPQTSLDAISSVDQWQLGEWCVKAVSCLLLTDAPIINCTESRRTWTTVGHSAQFTCRIRANPNCVDVTWTFARGDDMDHDLHDDPNIRISYKV